MRSVLHSDTCFFETKKSHTRQPVKESNSRALCLLLVFQLPAGWFPSGFSLFASLKLLVRFFPLGRKRLPHGVAKDIVLLLFTRFICILLSSPVKGKVFIVSSWGRPSGLPLMSTISEYQSTWPFGVKASKSFLPKRAISLKGLPLLASL